MRRFSLAGLFLASLAISFVATLAVLQLAGSPFGGSGERVASAFTLVSVGEPAVAGDDAVQPGSVRVPSSGKAGAPPAVPFAPLLLGLQGLLTDNAGVPVANGSHTVTFSLHTAATGGSQTWSETQSVNTNSGLFSTALGFVSPLTVAALSQSETWLQVQVSPDPPMTPRLRLFSAPYAVIASQAEDLACGACVGAADIASDAVDTAKIADGTVATADIAAAAIDSARLATASVTNVALAGDAVTTDKIAAGAVEESDLADGAVTSVKIADGAVTVADLVDGAVISAKIADGTITSADIADGTITAADLAAGSVGSTQIADGEVSSVDIAMGAVGTTQIADNSVTAADVAFNYAGSSSEGGGAVSLERPGHAIAIVDSAGSVGQFSSATIGEDGLPVIVYYDATDSTLNVVHCGNISCTQSNTISVVDTGVSVGITSIIIGADGFPAVAYRETNAQDLKFLHCGNYRCSSGNTTTTVDFFGNVGDYPSLALGADGMPVISYLDVTNYDLRVLHCGSAECNSGNSIATVDSAGNVGSYSSIAIGVDGMPVISYTDESNWDLKFARCGNLTCSSGNVITSVDTIVIVGDYTAVAIGADGLPIIAYHDISFSALNVLKCGVKDCSSGNTITELTTAGNVGTWTSITMAPDGMPIIAYRDETEQELEFYRCSNHACTAGSLVVVDTVVNAGRYASLTVGADGLPLIAYHDATNFDLRVVHCSNRFCVPYYRQR